MNCSQPQYRLPVFAILTLAVGLAGCDAQATTEYEGNSLFSMSGRIEVALEASDDLIPAIAFMAPGADEIRFVPAAVSGEFPANFRLDLYEPPPASVVDGFEYEEHPGEPRYTIGYIAAVTPNHLTTLYYGTSCTGTSENPVCNDEGCTGAMECKTFDASHRGTIHMFCPVGADAASITPPLQQCEITSRSGDPMLGSLWKDPMFAGAADNYAVAYLAGAAPAGGFVARRLGAPEGLSAGYHLLRTKPWYTWPAVELTAEQEAAEDAKQKCNDDARMLAVDRYNAAHGTDATVSDIFPKGCSSPGCEQFTPYTRALGGEWARLTLDMGCFMGPEFTPETDPDAVVSLRVQPGLDFISVASGIH